MVLLEMGKKNNSVYSMPDQTPAYIKHLWIFITLTPPPLSAKPLIIECISTLNRGNLPECSMYAGFTQCYIATPKINYV